MKKLNARMISVCSIALALGATAGCASKQVDLGNDHTAVTGSSLSDYEGTWEGYAEAYRFNDGTDKIRIALDGSGHGVLEVGDADPLPAPQADLAYPPRPDTDFSYANYGFVAGFSYPLIDAQVQSSRIQLKTIRSELYREWCELFTPVLDEANSGPGEDFYSCQPNIGYGQDPDGCFLGTDRAGNMPIACGALECLHTCQCTESSCGIGEPVPEIILDAALDDGGEVLEGTLLEVGERITVRMTRTD